MDLREHLLALLAPHGPGARLAADVRLIDVSVELGLRLRLEHRDGLVDVELALASEQSPHVVRTRHFLLAYRSGEGRAHVDPAVGIACCRAIADAMASNEDAVAAAIARESAPAALAPRIREVATVRALEPAGTAAEPFFALSPYVGCLVGCRFCYAQSRLHPLRRLEGLPQVPWGSWVDVRVDAPDVLARELETAPVLPIKFSPIVSDPYQAVERRHRITRRCLEVLARAAPRLVMVLTREETIEEDLERIAGLPRACVGFSLPTLDDEVRRHFEPRAAPIERRLAILRRFRDAGVPTLAVVQPLLPGSIDALADALAEHAGSVSLDVLRGVEGAADDFGHPRYRDASDDAWQRERKLALHEALARRGVPTWTGELPPPEAT